jgi:ABC-2 type transport system permease protein
MNGFIPILYINISKRFKEGYALGYNVIFPLILIGLLGLMSKSTPHGGITSFQYYHVVMIPFCMLMSMITAAYAGKDDAFANTAKRVLLTPVGTPALVIGKVTACTIVITVFSFFTYLFLGLFIPVDFTKSGYVFILFTMLTFMSSAVGCLIGLSIKKFIHLKNIMNIPICILGIFGGSFFPYYNNFSLMTWINRSIFLYLYDNQSNLLIFLCGALCLVGIFIVTLTIYFFQKEEYYVGSLPGYEK